MTIFLIRSGRYGVCRRPPTGGRRARRSTTQHGADLLMCIEKGSLVAALAASPGNAIGGVCPLCRGGTMNLRHPLLAVLLATAGVAGLMKATSIGPDRSAIRSDRVVQSLRGNDDPHAILYARGGTYHRRHRDSKPTPAQARRSESGVTDMAAAQASAAHQA